MALLALATSVAALSAPKSFCSQAGWEVKWADEFR
jgi:hypothetical protein